jgi:hypothetical protein
MTSPELSGTTESQNNGPAFSLENILGDDHDKLEHPDIRPGGWDEEDAEQDVAHGYCVECEGAWHVPLLVCSLYDYFSALQINLWKYIVKHVQMTIAKFVSQRSIGKVAGKCTWQRPWPSGKKRQAGLRQMGSHIMMRRKTDKMCGLSILLGLI